MSVINVILTGGVGSRLWPLSRKSQPKQYLPIFDGQTLFQKTVERNRNFCDKLIVVGNQENFLLSRRDLESSKVEEYTEIIEAVPRNTAAAIAFAAFAAHPEDILFVTPSDQLIDSGEHYDEAIVRGVNLAKEGYVVTFGLKPTKPETGYGYIESNGEQVVRFTEKPSFEAATEYLENGNYLWNSGMFCFKARTYLDTLGMTEREVYETSKIAYEKKEGVFLDKEISMNIPNISVDYAVMEKTNNRRVVASKFLWSDMGSFESIYQYLKAHGHHVDEHGNMVLGTDLHTEFAGMRDTILVKTKDAILVLNRNASEDVKHIYQRLENDKPELIN